VALTVGLGQIFPEIFIFELPLLFRTYEEFDFVRDKLTSYYEQKFNQKGYSFLGWGDLGYTYLFSKEPIRTQTDLQKSKLWVWDIDPIARSFATASGCEPIPMPVQTVLPAIKRGDIRTIYGPPLACIVFGWHTEVKYMTDLPLALGTGATLINNSRFNELSPTNRRMLQDICRIHLKELVLTIRKRNEESIAVLKKHGIKLLPVLQQEQAKWIQVATKVQTQMTGHLYERKFLIRVKKLISECRKIKK